MVATLPDVPRHDQPSTAYGCSCGLPHDRYQDCTGTPDRPHPPRKTAPTMAMCGESPDCIAAAVLEHELQQVEARAIKDIVRLVAAGRSVMKRLNRALAGQW